MYEKRKKIDILCHKIWFTTMHKIHNILGTHNYLMRRDQFILQQVSSIGTLCYVLFMVPENEIGFICFISTQVN